MRTGSSSVNQKKKKVCATLIKTNNTFECSLKQVDYNSMTVITLPINAADSKESSLGFGEHTDNVFQDSLLAKSVVV